MDLFMGNRPSGEVWRVDDEFEGSNGRRYTLGERIAAGGNGVIHECFENVTGDEFAVKFQLRLHGRRRRRFQQEVRLMRQVSHPHIVRYRDDGSVTTRNGRGDIPFLIMERATSDLERILRESGGVGYEAYIGQFRGLAEGLAMLHARAIHRDIKPGNILLFGERWVLSDLGLCQVAHSTLTFGDEVIGPRLWMSPEAVNKACGTTDSIRSASDVFQLASVFWFVITGRHPTGVVTRADYSGPPHLFDLLHRSLSHNWRLRPANGQAFARELDTAVRSVASARR